ncbi:MAG: hypothetical protein M3525_00525 [Acidobacteriota bacterium]|nr:hypothetical protein [Acidobacteriota bacterium]
MNLKITLSAVEKELFDAWETFCGDLPNVDIHHVEASAKHQELYTDKIRNLQWD